MGKFYFPLLETWHQIYALIRISESIKNEIKLNYCGYITTDNLKTQTVGPFVFCLDFLAPHALTSFLFL